MFKTKLTIYVCFLGILLPIYSAQVAKSQSNSSTVSESKSSSGRSYTATDPNYMNSVFPPGRIDLFHLVPILIMLAFIPLVLPLLAQLFTGLFTPLNFTYGRRRRSANLHKNPQISDLLLDILKKVGESIDKHME